MTTTTETMFEDGRGGGGDDDDDDDDDEDLSGHDHFASDDQHHHHQQQQHPQQHPVRHGCDLDRDEVRTWPFFWGMSRTRENREGRRALGVMRDESTGKERRGGGGWVSCLLHEVGAGSGSTRVGGGTGNVSDIPNSTANVNANTSTNSSPGKGTSGGTCGGAPKWVRCLVLPNTKAWAKSGPGRMVGRSALQNQATVIMVDVTQVT